MDAQRLQWGQERGSGGAGEIGSCQEKMQEKRRKCNDLKQICGAWSKQAAVAGWECELWIVPVQGRQCWWKCQEKGDGSVGKAGDLKSRFWKKKKKKKQTKTPEGVSGWEIAEWHFSIGVHRDLFLHRKTPEWGRSQENVQGWVSVPHKAKPWRNRPPKRRMSRAKHTNHPSCLPKNLSWFLNFHPKPVLAPAFPSQTCPGSCISIPNSLHPEFPSQALCILNFQNVLNTSSLINPQILVIPVEIPPFVCWTHGPSRGIVGLFVCLEFGRSPPRCFHY